MVFNFDNDVRGHRARANPLRNALPSKRVCQGNCPREAMTMLRSEHDSEDPERVSPTLSRPKWSWPNKSILAIPPTPDRAPNPHFLEKRVSGSKTPHFPSAWKREFSVKIPIFPVFPWGFFDRKLPFLGQGGNGGFWTPKPSFPENGDSGPCLGSGESQINPDKRSIMTQTHWTMQKADRTDTTPRHTCPQRGTIVHGSPREGACAQTSRQFGVRKQTTIHDS